jgi:hypothetical protein
MPYSRKTTRRPLRHVITLTQLTEANWQVTTEMERLGLWCDALDDIDVRLVPVSFACYGWFQPEADIYIPAVTGANLSDLITGHHTRLTDVLRHEWAHALADRCPELVETKRFTRTFGGAYESCAAVRSHDPEHHLTPYAAASPCEDFAETFHYYLRHKGRLPVRLTHKPKIARKWESIEWMANKIARQS